MSKKSQSQQERILTELYQKSFCGECAFAPDQWRADGRTGEPADLAWVIDNVVILMHMTSKKRHQTFEKKKRSRDLAIRHNLEELNGWMKEWRDCKRVLKGENDSKRFSIPYDDSLQVIALSIIDCDLAEVRIHKDEASELSIVLAATVPESFLLKLADIQGGMVDLVLLLIEFSEQNFHISEEAAIERLTKYQDASQAGLRNATYIPAGLMDSDIYRHMNSSIFSLRTTQIESSLTEDNPPDADANPTVRQAVLGDLTLDEMYTLPAIFCGLFDEFLKSKKAWSRWDLNMKYFDIRICFTLGVDYSALDEFQADWIKRVADEDTRVGPLIIFMVFFDLLNPIFKIWPTKRQTRIRNLVETFLNSKKSVNNGLS